MTEKKYYNINRNTAEKENDMKALVLASGGVDSTTCLGLAVNK